MNCHKADITVEPHPQLKKANTPDPKKAPAMTPSQ